MKKIIILLLLTTIIIFTLDYITQKEKGYIFLIPEEYKGKLVVIFNQKNMPSLKEKNGYLVVKFNKNGIVRTSTKPRFGKLDTKYFYYTEGMRMIPAIPGKNLTLDGGINIESKRGCFITIEWINNSVDINVSECLEEVENLCL